MEAASLCYAPPASSLTFDAFEDPPAPPYQDAVEERHRLRTAEARLVGLGQLLVVLGALGLSMSAGSLLGLSLEPLVALFWMVYTGLMRLVGTLTFALGVALWARAPGARALVPWVAVPSLTSVPLGTALGLCLLYVTRSAEGAAVLSERHAAIRRLSPEQAVSRGPGSFLALCVLPFTVFSVLLSAPLLALRLLLPWPL